MRPRCTVPLVAAAIAIATILGAPARSGADTLLVGRSATFGWDRAPGSVTHYGVYLAWNGDGFPSRPDLLVPASAPRAATIVAEPGESLALRVAAFFGPLRGALSDPSEVWTFVDPVRVQDTGALGARQGPADLRGDGLDDVVYVARSGEELLLREVGLLAPGVERSVPLSDGPWRLVARGDFDGDGREDLFWRHLEDGGNRIWYGSGASYETTFVEAEPDLAWRVLATGDFDGDGRDDLFWHHVDSGRTRAWLAGEAVEDGRFFEVYPLAPIPPQWTLSACGDFDGDGDDDLFWSHLSRPRYRRWSMELPEIVMEAEPPPSDPSYRVTAVGDFDSDGRDDLFWRHLIDGSGLIRFQRDSMAERDRSLPSMPLYWLIGASGDLNGDGYDDLVWTNPVDGSWSIWFMRMEHVVLELLQPPP